MIYIDLTNFPFKTEVPVVHPANISYGISVDWPTPCRYTERVAQFSVAWLLSQDFFDRNRYNFSNYKVDNHYYQI
jgi:hypothetical protein